MWIALCKYADTYCERQALLNVSGCLLISILIDLLERPLLKQRIPVILHHHKTSEVRLHIAKTSEIITTACRCRCGCCEG